MRAHLSERFNIAVRVRVIGEGKGYRLLQIQKTANRHLVDVRSAESLPSAQRMGDVLVITPPELIARKVIAYHSRSRQPKGFSDMRDLAMLFFTFPELKSKSGAVNDALERIGVSAEELDTWRELVLKEIEAPNDDQEFD
jgi:hypothetical protein